MYIYIILIYVLIRFNFKCKINLSKINLNNDTNFYTLIHNYTEMSSANGMCKQ